MVTIDGDEIVSGSTIDGDEISEITMDGDVVWVAMTEITSLDWSTSLFPAFTDYQVVLDGAVLMGSNDNAVIEVLNTSNGSTNWTDSLSGEDVNQVSTDGTRFFVGTGDSGEISAYSSSGTNEWTDSSSGRNGASCEPGWNYVYSMSSNDSPRVKGLNRSNGDTEVSFGGSGFNQDAVAEDPNISRVYRTENRSSGTDEYIEQYDFSGNQQWDTSIDDRNRGIIKPYIEQGDAYVATQAGTTYRIDGSNGDIKWSDTVSGVDNDRWIDYNNDGVFIGFDAGVAHYNHSGTLQWERTSGTSYRTGFSLIDDQQHIIFHVDNTFKQVDYTSNTEIASVSLDNDAAHALVDTTNNKVVGIGGDGVASGVNFE